MSIKFSTSCILHRKTPCQVLWHFLQAQKSLYISSNDPSFQNIHQAKLQYGVLIYGSTSKNVLKNLEKLTKRLIEFIFYKRSFESLGSLREEHKLFTVRELHIYELFKTLINILWGECKIASLSNLLSGQDLENLSSSRSKKISTSKNSCVKHCLYTRLRRLLNLVLIIEPMFIDKVKNLKENEIRKLSHNFLDNFILENEQLTEAIFS